MRTARRLALALLPLLASLPISATSYVPMTDEALVDQAPVIAVVEVQRSAPGQDGRRPGGRRLSLRLTAPAQGLPHSRPLPAA